jgi:hypothetical protein
LEFGTWNLGLGIWDLEFGSWNLDLGILKITQSTPNPAS